MLCFKEKLYFFVASYVSIFLPKLLLGYYIDTTFGVDYQKAIVKTSEYVLTGSDYAHGTVELRGGVRMNGGGTLGVNLPVGNYLRFSSSSTLRLERSVSFDGYSQRFLLDASSVGGAIEGVALWSLGGGSSMPTIYLDSDMTVSGNNSVTIANLVVDGQGHVIDFTHSLHGGFYLYGRCYFKNVTLKNVWSSIDYSTLAQSGNFIQAQSSGDYGQVVTTFDNVNIIARKFNPFIFYYSGGGGATGYVGIKNDVLLGNFGNYVIFNGFYGDSGRGLFTIFDNSKLIIQNSSLEFGATSILNFNNHRIDFDFRSDTAQIQLDNGEFIARNNNIVDDLAADITVTLTIGTLLVQGTSYLEADSLLARNGKATLKIGDGLSAANDMNIIINPGATLNLVSTNTNCLVKLQNVH